MIRAAFEVHPFAGLQLDLRSRQSQTDVALQAVQGDLAGNPVRRDLRSGRNDESNGLELVSS